MVCRRRDASNINGKYLSTEFLLSDPMGNIMHCVARNSIAHCFSGRLIEGEIYTINNFTVAPNRDSYRVRPDDKYIIQLEGNSTVKRNERISVDFLRYPFSLVPIEEVELNGRKFLIDVFGVAINMGKVKATRNGSQMMEFHLLNERGRSIKATLWGSICDGLIKISAAAVTPLIVILTGMNVREFRNDIYLSSTSATTIYDSPDIHAISSLRKIIGEPNVNVVFKAVKDIKSEVCTLSQLLDIGRSTKALKQKDSVTIQCGVEIVDICQKNSWHYFSCGKGNCKTGLSRTGGHFWCGACESECEFPVVRYRINMDVTDGTTSLVLTMFDDLAELLIKKKASTVMEELGVAVVDGVVPNDIMMLIGTKHTFEIKSHTYYNHGPYESFTISDIVAGTSVLEDGPKATVNTGEVDGIFGLDKCTEKATQLGGIENIDEQTMKCGENTDHGIDIEAKGVQLENHDKKMTESTTTTPAVPFINQVCDDNIDGDALLNAGNNNVGCLEMSPAHEILSSTTASVAAARDDDASNFTEVEEPKRKQRKLKK